MASSSHKGNRNENEIDKKKFMKKAFTLQYALCRDKRRKKSELNNQHK